MVAPPTSDEEQRLLSLKSYEVLDTATEPEFDEIVDLAGRICAAPISLITFVDDSRQWFKASRGLDIAETSRDVSFCAHAILQDQLMTVEDACLDARFKDNPLVTGEPQIRFYAGMPLITREGHRLGTLCVIDRKPRPPLNAEQAAALKVLSKQIVTMLDLRLSHSVQQFTTRSLEHLASIVEQNRDSIISMSPDGMILTWNQGAAMTFGIEAPNAVGRSIDEVLFEAGSQNLRQQILTAVHSDGVWHQEIIFRQPDGKLIHTSASVSALLKAKQIYCYVIQLQDVSVRKALEAQLKELNVLLAGHMPEGLREIRDERSFAEFIINSLPGIFYMFDEHGHFLRWNLGLEMVSGYSAEEIAGMHPLDFFDVDNQPKIGAAIYQAFADGSVMVEATFRTKNNQLLPYLFNGFSVRHNGQRCLLGMGLDISELSAYRQDLEKLVDQRTAELQESLHKQKELLAMQSQFITIASHEFRTPLSTINLSSGVLRRHWGKLSPAEVDRKFDLIEKQVRHMAHLLDDVLTVGKIEAGKWNLTLGNVSVVDFVSEIAEEIGYLTNDSNPIQLQLEQVPPFIHTDDKLLRNMLQNLLTNAVKFSHPGDVITVRLAGAPTSLTIEVSDHGIGIPTEDLPRIFQPFIRAENAAHIQGTGLGLSIAARAAEILGGSIHVESQLNQGSRFTVKIPLEPASR
ncbi:MAG: PAS domain S-box protein [Cyclobacteriaceae bacterium]